ncbi:hypothetical protein [Pedobacter sp. P26]|uniref:hypothetical protein n=1 Tax=Pedobacter sp. P26 TaxID=3423956 RepID=UPI003D678B89
MQKLFNDIGEFFVRNDKLWPPIITGCVTVSVFLFTIWKDKIKDGRKKRNESKQKSIYLLNLLEDASGHLSQQIENNKSALEELSSSPTEFALVTYLPINYLDRLSKILANDAYFSAFNTSYKRLKESERIRIYNDLAIDVDLFHGNLTELYRYIEKSSAHFDTAKDNYFVNSKTLLKNLSDLHLELDNNNTDTIDRDELLSKLDKLDHQSIISALVNRDMINLDSYIRALHEALATFLIPDFLYIKKVTSLCQDCQNVNEQYHTLLNSNMVLAESITALNLSIKTTLDDFVRKIDVLKSIKK